MLNVYISFWHKNREIYNIKSIKTDSNYLWLYEDYEQNVGQGIPLSWIMYFDVKVVKEEWQSNQN